MTTAIDTETSLIFPGVLAPPLVCVSFAGPEGKGVLHRTDADLLGRLRNWFAGDTTFANGPYDLAVLINWNAELLDPIFEALRAGRVHDVQTREKLGDLARGTFRFEEDEDGVIKHKGYTLALIGERRGLGGKTHDEWRLRYHELHDVPVSMWPREAVFYAMRDAVLTSKIHEQQEGDPNLGNEAEQVRAHFALHLASCRGIMTNPEAVEALEVATLERMAELLPTLVEHGLARKDGTRDTKAAVRRMARLLGDACVLTAKGEEVRAEGRDPYQIARDEGTFVSVAEEPCLLSGDDVLLAYSHYAKARNLFSGSIKDLKRGTVVPIQTRFGPIVETGRTSSASPNIQNLRRAPGVRECFVPREGHVFVAADYAQAELHTLAQVCLDLFGESALAEMLNAGVDVHCKLGADLIGMEYDEFKRRYDEDDEEIEEIRQPAKHANFAFPGGASVRRFCAIVRSISHGKLVLDEAEAARLRTLWFRMLPEMRAYFDHVDQCVDDRGWHWVKQSRVDRLRARATYCAACNSHFQGLAADGAKAALWKICDEQWTGHGPLLGTRLVNFVHDEFLVECREEDCDAVALALSEVAAREFNQYVPDCPTTCDLVVMRHWSKKAKAVHDADGRLIPWPQAS